LDLSPICRIAWILLDCSRFARVQHILHLHAEQSHLSPRGELGPVLLVTASALGVVAIAAVALGRLSDHIGRRPAVVGSTAALLILPLPMSLVAVRGSLASLFVAEDWGGVAVAGVLSVAMLGELFAVPVRSTGFALTAGLATAIIGGTCAVWLPNFSSPLLILRPDRGSMLRSWLAWP
jgi:MFS transporter, MHS family, proline/betaine transporter